MADTSSNNNQDMFETPGQLLRLNREKMGLSAQDIANRVHLDIKVIEAIEADSSEGMPSAIYVRGYLRSYAKAVDADADKIIELYNNDAPQALPEILPEVKPPTQVSSNDKPVKAFTYLLTLGLVLLLLIWYQSNFVVEKQPKSIEGTHTDTESTINGVDITYDIIIHDNTSWQSPVIPDEEIMAPPTMLEMNEENELLKLQTFNEEQTIEISTTDNIQSIPVEQITKISTTENTEVVAVEQTVTSDQDIIELELTNDSWIEILDKENNKVFFDLATAGNTYTLEGKAPFEILFGYAEGVRLTFNGKPINFEAYSKNGVARFTLPE